MISTVNPVTASLSAADIMAYSIIAIIALIALLALKEILSSETENTTFKSFVKGSNIAIVPLLLVFVAIVAYKVVTVL